MSVKELNKESRVTFLPEPSFQEDHEEIKDGEETSEPETESESIPEETVEEQTPIPEVVPSEIEEKIEPMILIAEEEKKTEEYGQKVESTVLIIKESKVKKGKGTKTGKGASKKGKPTKGKPKKATPASNEFELVGKSNDELVKMYSQSLVPTKSRSKTRSKKSLQRLTSEAEGEDTQEDKPSKPQSWETNLDQDAESLTTQDITPKEEQKEAIEGKSSLRSSQVKKPPSKKSVAKFQSKVMIHVESTAEVPEDAESKPVVDKPKPKKKGKKKKDKDKPDDVVQLAPVKSTPRESFIQQAFNTMSSTSYKQRIARMGKSVTSGSKSRVSAEPESSSSSSSTASQPKSKRRSGRSSFKIGRKKTKFKREPREWSTEMPGEDDEILQKITDPSVTSTGNVNVEPPKKPPKKKKKVKKEPKPKKGAKAAKDKAKEKFKTDAQIEEEAKAKAEEERLIALVDKKNAIAKEKKEILEASMRDEQLDLITTEMELCEAALDEVIQAAQAEEEWRQYLVCDGLPAPWDVPGMNTYIHLWEKEVYTVSSERCKERTTEAINLLNQLDDIREDPFDKSERRRSDWAWVASRFREFQALNLEYCTYRLLRDIKSKMNRIDIPTADFRMQEDLFSLCLWVSITLPTPTPNPRSVAKPRIKLTWPELCVDIMFPQTLKREMVAIRGMYTYYDHLTDTSETFRAPPLPPYYLKTLSQACQEEIFGKMKYKYDNRVKPKMEPVEVIQDDGTVVVMEPEAEPELDEDVMAPHVPYRKLDVSPSVFQLNKMDVELKESLLQLEHEIPPGVLNLRKYTVIGGVYFLDLYYQPPQPQGMVSYEVFISTLTEPYSLQTVPYVVKYDPPPPHEPGTRRTPEEIEEELLQQEKELDELILLEITLPKHVYWLEPPMVVQWDYGLKAWTLNNVFDFKNIEEKGYVTFRTGIFRPIAIATLKWSNLPYQAWEIRPEKDGTVTFQLSCAILTLEFHVQQNTICVKDIQSAPNDAFEPHLNVYYSFSKLRKIMRSIGIDVFPYFDTFLYVEGTCEKYWPMENHLYFCMAYLSVVFNMTWSRWNMTLDYRAIVFQMRAYRFDRPKQANFDTVLVRAQSTAYIDCTEVSQEFSDVPVEGMRFFADLWHLVRSTSIKSLRSRITSADKTMVKTLYRLYKNVRFLSFS